MSENILGLLRKKLRLIRAYIQFRYYRNPMMEKITHKDSGYQNYLSTQLIRTLEKRKAPLQKRTQIMVDKLEAVAHLYNGRVLCVGCRNSAELDYFESKEVSKVVGIDLYSEDPRIRVMDMHQIQYPDNYFDILYSSHSLEHARDVERVIAEFLRVVRSDGIIAIEVPVHFLPTAADLVDFDNLQNLREAFGPNIKEVLWTDEQGPQTNNNQSGNAIIRTIFRITK